MRMADCSIDRLDIRQMLMRSPPTSEGEGSTMSTEMIVWIYVLFILFGGGGFYWIRNR